MPSCFSFSLRWFYPLPPAQYYTPLSIVLQPQFTRSNPLNLFVPPLHIHRGFKWYLTGLVVFHTFFNLSLKFTMRRWWSEPQGTPGLVLCHYIELLHFWLQEYNQFDFGIDHLGMSMCRVVSFVVERGCLLWSVCSSQNSVSLCPA